MLKTESSARDTNRDMDEVQWWNFWNSSYRADEITDPISTELFARTAALVNEVSRNAARRVLEVGCGAGTLSRLLDFSVYHGLDVSPAAINIARQKAERFPRRLVGGSWTYEVADIHDWPMLSQPFDVVLCVDAVAYFRDQRLAMEKFAGSLRPEGSLVLTTINPFVYRRIRRTTQSPLREGSVSHWLPRRELHALVTSAGFTIDRSFTIMPRGNRGIWRLINSPRLERALGERGAKIFQQLKESLGLGQYRVIVARKAVD
jgi:2-polyprenyl-3-methyl-5-hydroxy-6-metoxy-1,4-benzoquinol methylase